MKPVEKKTVVVSDEGTLSEYGEVVAIGDACTGTIEVGTKIGFSVFGVEKLVIDDEKYYFIKQDDEFLLCTIQDELPAV